MDVYKSDMREQKFSWKEVRVTCGLIHTRFNLSLFLDSDKIKMI